MSTVKARVAVLVEPKAENRELPVIDSTWFDEHGEPLLRTADRLWELGLQEDSEVGILLETVPKGVEVRKPFGETWYARADDDWVRRTLEITDPRIILVGDRGNLTLEKADRVMVARLSDIFEDRWEEIDYELGDMRCPK